MKKNCIFVIFLYLLFSFAICFFSVLPLQQNFLHAHQSISLPILMYHSILNNSKGTYIVSKWQLEQDLLALEQNGYTTVFPSQVVDFVYNQKPLPPNPIIISFDDGFYNNLFYALEIFQKHNAKANINIIGILADQYTNGDHSNPNYSYLTWEQTKMLAQSGCFEIGNHTYDMHKFSPRYGIGQKCCESDQEYTVALNQDIDLFENALQKNTNLATNIFAYPFGKYNNLSMQILKSRNYKFIMTCEEHSNKISNNPDCLLNLGRINRSGSLSTATVIQKVKNCT